MKTLKKITLTLETLKPTLKERFRVENIGVFGAFTRGKQTETSDIDSLKTYKTDGHPGLFETDLKKS